MTTTTANPTKYITCPVCGSAAQIYAEPSMWAGIWECTNTDCGANDSCEHTVYHSEAATVDEMNGNECDSLSAIVNVCDDCGMTLEPTTNEYGDDHYED